MVENRLVIGSVCSSHSWGGLEMNILQHLRWLRQRGWTIILFVEPESPLALQAVNFDITVRTVHLGSKKDLLITVPRLVKLIAEDNVRILLTHQSKDIPLGVFTKRFSENDVRLIYAQQMHVGRDKNDMIHTWLYRQLDAWVTPLHWLEDRIYEKTNLPKGKTHVIPLGVDMQRFTNGMPDKQSARQELGLDGSAFIIGVVGRLDPKKCQDTVISAVKKVCDLGHDVQLLLVGDRTVGESESYALLIEKLIQDLSLQSIVTLMPARKDVEMVYTALDLFVLPSASETYGMVTIEAMASQLPIIATRSGGTQEIVTHAQTGLLYSPRNDQELADCIIRFITDREFANDCAHRARTDAIHRFSHEIQCDGLERLFNELISQKEKSF